MATNWTKRRARVQKRLMSSSSPVIVRHVAPSVFDPATSTTASAAPVLCTFYGCTISDKQSDVDGKVREWNDEYKSGTMITFGDGKVFLSPGYTDASGLIYYDVVPGSCDVVIANGVEYAMKSISPLCPSGVTVGYILELRG